MLRRAPRSTGWYRDALTRLHVLEDQPAWAPQLRSKAVLRTSPKRHFVDPSLAVAALAVAALGTGAQRLRTDLITLGLLFESLVVRDLRVLAQPLDGEVFHYRDSYGAEIDAIVECADGRWGASEVKLGAAQIDAAAKRLLGAVEGIDTHRIGSPRCLG